MTDLQGNRQVLVDTARMRNAPRTNGVTMYRALNCCVVGLLLTGCGAKSLKVGSDDNPSSDPTSLCRDASVAVDLPDWTSPNACVVGSEITSIVGLWDGYYQGQSGEENTFRLDIVGANLTNGICGTITFGTHTAPVAYPPPATDPTAVYPPAGFSSSVRAMNGMMTPILGLPYTILNGRIDGQRVSFGFSVNEILKSWCALQTSYAWDDSCTWFGCLPNGSIVGSTDPAGTCTIATAGQKKTYSCAQTMMCNMSPRCSCDATHCVATSSTGSTFDLIFADGGATGVGNGSNVILNRVSTPDM